MMPADGQPKIQGSRHVIYCEYVEHSLDKAVPGRAVSLTQESLQETAAMPRLMLLSGIAYTAHPICVGALAARSGRFIRERSYRVAYTPSRKNFLIGSVQRGGISPFGRNVSPECERKIDS
jgi:hypothetical protein